MTEHRTDPNPGLERLLAELDVVLTTLPPATADAAVARLRAAVQSPYKVVSELAGRDPRVVSSQATRGEADFMAGRLTTDAPDGFTYSVQVSVA